MSNFQTFLRTFEPSNPRTVFIVSLLVALGALGAALIAQFGFDLKPCIMCLWQRLPYLLIIFLSIGGLMRYDLANYFLALIFLCFLGSVGAAFFHVGIEQHWWALSGGCPVEPLGEKTEAQALAELLVTPLSSCDKIEWWLLGQSITVWNVALSFIMSFYLAFVLWKQNREEEE